MSGSRLLIGFVGAKRSGKGLAASRLVTRGGWRAEKFAAPVKAMLKAMGASDAELETDLKERPCAALGGRTPRQAMQSLGHWCRTTLGEDYLVEHWRRRAASAMERGEGVAVDDVRLPAEAAVVRDMGGVLVRVTRALPPAVLDTDVTETSWQQIECDFDLVFDGDRQAFATDVDRLLDRIGIPSGEFLSPALV